MFHQNSVRPMQLKSQDKTQSMGRIGSKLLLNHPQNERRRRKDSQDVRFKQFSSLPQGTFANRAHSQAVREVLAPEFTSKGTGLDNEAPLVDAIFLNNVRIYQNNEAILQNLQKQMESGPDLHHLAEHTSEGINSQHQKQRLNVDHPQDLRVPGLMLGDQRSNPTLYGVNEGGGSKGTHHGGTQNSQRSSMGSKDIMKQLMIKTSARSRHGGATGDQSQAIKIVNRHVNVNIDQSNDSRTQAVSMQKTPNGRSPPSPKHIVLNPGAECNDYLLGESREDDGPVEDPEDLSDYLQANNIDSKLLMRISDRKISNTELRNWRKAPTMKVTDMAKNKNKAKVENLYIAQRKFQYHQQGDVSYEQIRNQLDSTYGGFTEEGRYFDRKTLGGRRKASIETQQREGSPAKSRPESQERMRASMNRTEMGSTKRTQVLYGTRASGSRRFSSIKEPHTLKPNSLVIKNNTSKNRRVAYTNRPGEKVFPHVKKSVGGPKNHISSNIVKNFNITEMIQSYQFGQNIKDPGASGINIVREETGGVLMAHDGSFSAHQTSTQIDEQHRMMQAYATSNRKNNKSSTEISNENISIVSKRKLNKVSRNGDRNKVMSVYQRDKPGGLEDPFYLPKQGGSTISDCRNSTGTVKRMEDANLTAINSYLTNHLTTANMQKKYSNFGRVTASSHHFQEDVLNSLADASKLRTRAPDAYCSSNQQKFDRVLARHNSITKQPTTELESALMSFQRSQHSNKNGKAPMDLRLILQDTSTVTERLSDDRPRAQSALDMLESGINNINSSNQAPSSLPLFQPHSYSPHIEAALKQAAQQLRVLQPRNDIVKILEPLGNGVDLRIDNTKNPDIPNHPASQPWVQEGTFDSHVGMFALFDQRITRRINKPSVPGTPNNVSSQLSFASGRNTALGTRQSIRSKNAKQVILTTTQGAPPKDLGQQALIGSYVVSGESKKTIQGLQNQTTFAQLHPDQFQIHSNFHVVNQQSPAVDILNRTSKEGPVPATPKMGKDLSPEGTPGLHSEKVQQRQNNKPSFLPVIGKQKLPTQQSSRAEQASDTLRVGRNHRDHRTGSELGPNNAKSGRISDDSEYRGTQRSSKIKKSFRTVSARKSTRTNNSHNTQLKSLDNRQEHQESSQQQNYTYWEQQPIKNIVPQIKNINISSNRNQVKTVTSSMNSISSSQPTHAGPTNIYLSTNLQGKTEDRQMMDQLAYYSATQPISPKNNRYEGIRHQSGPHSSQQPLKQAKNIGYKQIVQSVINKISKPKAADNRSKLLDAAFQQHTKKNRYLLQKGTKKEHSMAFGRPEKWQQNQMIQHGQDGDFPYDQVQGQQYYKHTQKKKNSVRPAEYSDNRNTMSIEGSPFKFADIPVDDSLVSGLCDKDTFQNKADNLICATVGSNTFIKAPTTNQQSSRYELGRGSFMNQDHEKLNGLSLKTSHQDTDDRIKQIQMKDGSLEANPESPLKLEKEATSLYRGKRPKKHDIVIQNPPVMIDQIIECDEGPSKTPHGKLGTTHTGATYLEVETIQHPDEQPGALKMRPDTEQRSPPAQNLKVNQATETQEHDLPSVDCSIRIKNIAIPAADGALKPDASPLNRLSGLQSTFRTANQMQEQQEKIKKLGTLEQVHQMKKELISFRDNILRQSQGPNPMASTGVAFNNAKVDLAGQLADVQEGKDALGQSTQADALRRSSMDYTHPVLQGRYDHSKNVDRLQSEQPSLEQCLVNYEAYNGEPRPDVSVDGVSDRSLLVKMDYMMQLSQNLELLQARENEIILEEQGNRTRAVKQLQSWIVEDEDLKKLTEQLRQMGAKKEELKPREFVFEEPEIKRGQGAQQQRSNGKFSRAARVNAASKVNRAFLQSRGSSRGGHQRGRSRGSSQVIDGAPLNQGAQFGAQGLPIKTFLLQSFPESPEERQNREQQRHLQARVSPPVKVIAHTKQTQIQSIESLDHSPILPVGAPESLDKSNYEQTHPLMISNFNSSQVPRRGPALLPFQTSTYRDKRDAPAQDSKGVNMQTYLGGHAANFTTHGPSSSIASDNYYANEADRAAHKYQGDLQYSVKVKSTERQTEDIHAQATVLETKDQQAPLGTTKSNRRIFLQKKSNTMLSPAVFESAHQE